MSFVSDDAALSALCDVILKRGFAVSVLSEGEAILDGSRSAVSIMTAVNAVSDDCVLVLHAMGRRAGWFLVLLQDDPDCLIVDYPVNPDTETIWREWSVIGGICNEG